MNPKLKYNENGFCSIWENSAQYLVHEDGEKWTLATSFQEFREGKEAIDFSQSDPPGFPEILYQNPTFEILFLNIKNLELIPRDYVLSKI